MKATAVHQGVVAAVIIIAVNIIVVTTSVATMRNIPVSISQLVIPCYTILCIEFKLHLFQLICLGIGILVEHVPDTFKCAEPETQHVSEASPIHCVGPVVPGLSFIYEVVDKDQLSAAQ